MRWKNGTIALAVWLASVGAGAHAGPMDGEGDAIPYASPEAALVALRASPHVSERLENDWFALQDHQGHVLWSITAPGNAMHPSMVKRTLVQRDGGVEIGMSIKCGASRQACDTLVQTFQASNDRLRQRLRDTTTPAPPSATAQPTPNGAADPQR
ncbi:hypothetical protein [Stenotrophomonas sp. BIGb0135]|uniref:hypothetical protein n=1 Tax=Stenotrophomonas sp. BIGb0135 TaxID=2940620 RepID=UPI00216A1E0E|nr:hypothetical protein [Stenotrophomonas sp. BIGb0135]MCS4235237.1 hypothetical protein [Stenotrophomonas sp. BIGb0135]